MTNTLLMILGKSNYGSQKKLNLKITSKTPSNGIIDQSSLVTRQSEPLTSEQKLKQFHEWRIRYMSNIDINKSNVGHKIRFNSSIDHTYLESKSSKCDVLEVPEYADEIFANEKLKSKFWMPKVDYMAMQTDINQKMRRILVDWLIKVHQKFKLLPETLFLTVNIIDRYLS